MSTAKAEHAGAAGYNGVTGAAAGQQGYNGSGASGSQQSGGGGGSSSGHHLTYAGESIIGNGSFGVVFKARLIETGETVAIKKVLQDKRFKNRELQIMKRIHHPNVVQLKHCFYSNGERGADELYLNLVLEFIPETVYSMIKMYTEANGTGHKSLPLICVRLYLYQLCRALSHVHAMGICHRDIKPQNLLVDPSTHVLKLCDFGSAKQLVQGEPNVSYICSRYYRAPELIFGATDYTTQIDVWSLGCVGAELLLGTPLFPSKDSADQLFKIFHVMGTPTREEIHAMNPMYTEVQFTQVQPINLEKAFPTGTPADVIDFLRKTLTYTPTARITPTMALLHPAFDELRRKSAKLPDGRPLPALFNFTDLELSVNPSLNDALRRVIEG